MRGIDEYEHVLDNVYEDSLLVYTEFNDNYNYALVDRIDKFIGEGVYCYQGLQGEDITIKPGYTVVDAGAWIGDFSAYAAVKAAHVYAFEPSAKNQFWLRQTAELNGNIDVVPFALGENCSTEYFDESDENSGGYKISECGKEKIAMVSLDTSKEKIIFQK